MFWGEGGLSGKVVIQNLASIKSRKMAIYVG
jgi:hypothetical protein